MGDFESRQSLRKECLFGLKVLVKAFAAHKWSLFVYNDYPAAESVLIAIRMLLIRHHRLLNNRTTPIDDR